jgi:hypothetical protein
VPNLMVEVDGETVPLASCAWIQREKCGCVVSVALAVAGDRVLVSEEQAHKHFTPRRPSREKEIREGLRTELITMATYDASLRHSPWECELHQKQVAQ